MASSIDAGVAVGNSKLAGSKNFNATANRQSAPRNKAANDPFYNASNASQLPMQNSMESRGELRKFLASKPDFIDRFLHGYNNAANTGDALSGSEPD